MDDDSPGTSWNQRLSISLERPVADEAKSRLTCIIKPVTPDEAIQLARKAAKLFEQGVSPLESAVVRSKTIPPDIKEEALQLHDRLNEIVGPIGETITPRAERIPQFVSIRLNHLHEIKRLLGCAGSFTDFIQKMRQYHWAPRCNVVWRQNTVAYRCQTCGLNSCMSLCAECFEKADHEGHDYSRFFSTVGGCCDCGNPDVMDPKGFCECHQEGAPRKSKQAPAEILALVKYVIVKILTRIMVSLRRWKKFLTRYQEFTREHDPGAFGKARTNEAIHRGILPLINFLTELSEGGSAITDILIEILLDENLYSELCCGNSAEALASPMRAVEAPDWRLLPNLQEDLDTLRQLKSIHDLPDKSCLHPLKLDCILDELVVYLIRIAYPQELIDLLLNLLYDMKYKERFAKKFFSYYPYTTAMVGDLLKEIHATNNDGAKIAERIVHISVQICSGANICSWLQNEINIIDCVLQSAVMMTVTCAKQTPINHDQLRFYNSQPESLPQSGWLVANFEDNQFFVRNAELFVLTDTQNLTVHQAIAKALFADQELVQKYIRHVEFFQGMGTEWRIVSGDHRVNDWATVAQKCYNVEFEACSLPMHNLIQHISSLKECQIFYSVILEAILRWFYAIKLEQAPVDTYTPPFCATFHLPLHRHLASLLFQMECLGTPCKTIIERLRSEDKLLKQLILYPIRIHAIRAEFYAGMWTRNGQGMRIAVSHYCKPTITFSFQSADLILIRFGASNINQEFFWKSIIKSFHIDECFTYPDLLEELENDDDSTLVTRRAWIPYLVDGAVRLILDLIIGRRDTEPDSEELLEEEMIALLARQNLPYSHVRAVIPTRGNLSFDQQMAVFDQIIGRVANFVEPDQNHSLQHGRFELKDELYETRVCPVFCRLRSFGMVDYSEFTNRMESRDREKCSLPSAVAPWLPFRSYDFDKLYQNRFKSVRGTPALLTQPSFFILCQKILRKVNEMQYYHSTVFQEVIYLLTLSVQFLKSNLFDECHHLLFHVNEMPLPAFHDNEAYTESIRTASDPRQVIRSFFLRNFGGHDSIFTLLIELFIKLVRQQKPELQEYAAVLELKNYLHPLEESDERIYGAGAEYLGRLLRGLFQMDEIFKSQAEIFVNSTAAAATEVPMEVDQPTNVGDSAALERKERLKKKKEAYLKQLQQKGKTLMKHHMKTEGISQSEMDRMETKTNETTTYECPICSETTDHSLANPIGIFIHTRPNSVISNSAERKEAVTELMDLAPSPRISSSTSGSGFSRCEPEKREKKTVRTKRDWYWDRDEDCYSTYNDESKGEAAVRALRFRSGIEVRTCGHFAHLQCFKSYMNSLTNSLIIRVDFTMSCPMCRAPVNAILPLKIEYGREKSRADFEIDEVDANYQNIVSLYTTRLLDPRPTFSENETMRKLQNDYREAYDSFEDLAYRQLMSSKDPSVPAEKFFIESKFRGFDARMGFVLSNLERMVMCATLDLPLPSFSKNSVIEHIMSGAVTLARRSEQEVNLLYWDALIQAATGRLHQIDKLEHYPPMICCDLQSLFLRIAASPLTDERYVDTDRMAYAKLIYRIFINLGLTRVILNSVLKCKNRQLVEFFIKISNFGTDSIIAKSLQSVLEAGREFFLAASELPFESHRDLELATDDQLLDYTKQQAELILVPLTKFVIILMKNAFKDDLTESEKQLFIQGNFADLYTVVFGTEDARPIQSVAISVRLLMSHFMMTMKRQTAHFMYQLTVKECFDWKYRSVLRLPPLYDKLFSAFFGQKCNNCHREPKHQMLCLLCGTFMCLQRCNPRDDQLDDSTLLIEQHTLSCGSGCCCYLSLNSTMIVINYYRQAVLWGTVYLDAHGEEDRNLYRGKPLYLSENRMNQLLKSWYIQDLDRRAHLRCNVITLFESLPYYLPCNESRIRLDYSFVIFSRVFVHNHQRLFPRNCR
uniref:E3 ubiquitin-protein ligase n=1 Tax=Panagrolaimus sp. JU765 TaxID=591449 RepID=A0AC34PXA7_9BILA